MTLEEIKQVAASKEYDFLRTNPHLGNNVILLGLGGSHAYGTNREGSDLDVRGCALNSKIEILTNENFEQFTNEETDTVIYSFNKLISLLSNCNPNVIEMLGLKPEHYLYLSSIGQELLDNKHLFLSKRAIHSFGGYANAQLRRLDNKAVRDVEQAKREQHVMNSINNAKYYYKEHFFPMSETDYINLYLDVSQKEEFEKEIFVDIHITHYPLRDFKGMMCDMGNVLSDYAKIGSRNSKAIAHGKLAKHMMHLVRLYLMAFDILEKGQIITYREADHDFLMEILHGKYLDEKQQPIPEFFDLVKSLETRLEYAKLHTELPEKPNHKAIRDFSMSVNERIVRGDI